MNVEDGTAAVVSAEGEVEEDLRRKIGLKREEDAIEGLRV